MSSEIEQLNRDLWEALHRAEEWEESHNIEKRRADDLEDVLKGRTTPPTGPEMVAHEARGGLWRFVSTMNGAVIYGCSDDGVRWIYGDPMASLPKRVGYTYETRYWALDAQRNLTAWPKV